MKNKIKVGIMPEEKLRQRMIGIAKGDYKPKSDEPKVWCASMKSFHEINDGNRYELINCPEKTI